SSFGTTASASEDSVIPVKMLQPSRSTISCALRTASAGLPPVVFDQQLDWTAEEATLGVLHFRPQLATALELLPDRTERTGQSERCSNFYRLGRGCVANAPGHSKARSTCDRRAKDSPPRHLCRGRHRISSRLIQCLL